MAKQIIDKKPSIMPKLPKDEDNPRVFAVRSLKATADAKRTFAEKFADWITTVSGSVLFLGLNVTWFVVWILINTGKVPGIEPFDPYPFGFLTMCVSLEAICLAVLVLISQNREAHIGDVREEIDLHINKIAEAEITQIIKMLAQVLEKQGVDTKDDKDLQRMLRPIRSGDIQRKIEEQTSRRHNKHRGIPMPPLPDLPTPPWDQSSKK